MKITVKLRFKSERPRIEKFGNNRYLAYLSSGEEDYHEELRAFISRNLGVPMNSVKILGLDSFKDVMVEI